MRSRFVLKLYHLIYPIGSMLDKSTLRWSTFIAKAWSIQIFDLRISCLIIQVKISHPKPQERIFLGYLKLIDFTHINAVSEEEKEYSVVGPFTYHSPGMIKNEGKYMTLDWKSPYE